MNHIRTTFIPAVYNASLHKIQLIFVNIIHSVIVVCLDRNTAQVSIRVSPHRYTYKMIFSTTP